METVKVADLTINADKLLAEMQKTKKSIDTLRASQTELRKSGDTSSQNFIKQETQLKTLNAEYRSQQKTLQQVTGVTDGLNKELKTEARSLGEAEAQNKSLRQARTNLNLTTDEGKAALEEINAKLNENTDFMKANQDEQIQSKMNVGNYTQSITEALGLTQAHTQATKVMTTVQGGLNVVVGKSTGVMKLFKIALASTGVGLLVVALGSLVTYLTSTQDGINKVNRVLTPLKEVFNTLMGVVQDFGKSLFDAFSNPKQLISDLANMIKTNLINRFTALGKIIKSAMSLDWKGVADGVLQAGTGVENLTGKVQKIGKAASDLMSDAIARGKEIEDISQNLSKTEAEYILQQSKLNKEFAEQSKLSEDTTKSQEERVAAARAAIKAQSELTKGAVARLRQEAQLLSLQMQANDTSDEDRTRLATKLAEIDKAIEEEASKTKEAQNKLNGLLQTGENERKAIRDKAIQDNITSIEEEITLYEETNKRKLKSDEDRLKHLQTVNNKEKAILDSKLKNGLISQQAYNIEIQKLDNDLADFKQGIRDKELQREQDFNDKKASIEHQIALLRAEDEQERAVLRLEQQHTNFLEELDQMVLQEEERLELQKLLEEQKQLELKGIRDRYAEDEKETSKDVADEVKSLEDAKVKAKEDATAAIEGLFKEETAAAKAVQIAKEALAFRAMLIEKSTFDQGQAKNIAETTGDIASGTAKTASSAPFPFNIPLIAGFILQTAGLLSSIKSIAAPTPTKFAKGGLLNGPSHLQGGIKTPFGELEGGESVINKRSTSMYGGLLSAINVAGGGVPIMGGNNAPTGLIDYDLLANKVALANMALPSPTVSVEEITNTNNRVVQITERARF